MQQTQRAVTNIPGAIVRSDERIQVRLHRIYPLLCWTPEDNLVALIVQVQHSEARVIVELTLVDNNTPCVVVLWQATPEHGGVVGVS